MSQDETFSLFQTHIKREPLQLESTSLTRVGGDDHSGANPSSALNLCYPSAYDRSSSRNSELRMSQDETKPIPNSQRSGSVSSKSDKEKRKRSRVTPSQLNQLEAIFASDRSPTAARRREISERLGMHERQTQIWFQNRRAKAKLQDGKPKGRSESMEVPPNTPPELSIGVEVELHNLIHESEPVTIIPCSDLTIGNWRRISSVAKRDLIAYVSEAKRSLSWFIRSDGFGFKMEIPFDSIAETEFDNSLLEGGIVTFLLTNPPIFYLENTSSPDDDGTIHRDWKRCSDWTEGHEASRVLRHTLVGSAVQLAHLLQSIHHITGTNPTYGADSMSTSPIEAVPAPSMAGLIGPGYHFSNAGSGEVGPPLQLTRRTSMGDVELSPGSSYADHRTRSIPASSGPVPSFARYYNTPLDRQMPAGPSRHFQASQSQVVEEYNEDYNINNISSATHTPFSASYPIHPTGSSYFDSVPHFIQNHTLRRPASTSMIHFQHHPFSTPSIVTSHPYYPLPSPTTPD
ncbi:hypothetical protein BDQ12DRAFT_482423 [Crucibulum laeve]|uniref:Homeobox domain-containing protein n=1 Tax=Crucibulum laeve TaxID=68775 RepID=A0A5C3M5V3_9AGAR|nr:hypothetical protein BDQ12DRAFT_482423 [Crucibulum laeve]